MAMPNTRCAWVSFLLYKYPGAHMHTSLGNKHTNVIAGPEGMCVSSNFLDNADMIFNMVVPVKFLPAVYKHNHLVFSLIFGHLIF